MKGFLLFVVFFISLVSAQSVFRGKRGAVQGDPSLCVSQWKQTLQPSSLQSVDVSGCGFQNALTFNGFGNRVMLTEPVTVSVPNNVDQLQLVFDLFSGNDDIIDCPAARDGNVFEIKVVSATEGRKTIAKFVSRNFRTWKTVVISLRFKKGQPNSFIFKFSQLGTRHDNSDLGVWSVNNIQLRYACTGPPSPSPTPTTSILPIQTYLTAATGPIPVGSYAVAGNIWISSTADNFVYDGTTFSMRSVVTGDIFDGCVPCALYVKIPVGAKAVSFNMNYQPNSTDCSYAQLAVTNANSTDQNIPPATGTSTDPNYQIVIPTQGGYTPSLKNFAGLTCTYGIGSFKRIGGDQYIWWYNSGSPQPSFVYANIPPGNTYLLFWHYSAANFDFTASLASTMEVMNIQFFSQ